MKKNTQQTVFFKKFFTCFCKMTENNVTYCNNIVIYNELGQFVMETKLKTIDTSSLSSGLYFVKVKTDEGTSYRTVKIIKK